MSVEETGANGSFCGVTLTVFTRSPVAVPLTTAVTMNVATPPFARFAVALMSVLSGPDGVTDDPGVADATHDTLAIFGLVEKTSVTFASLTLPGPSLATTIV